MLSLLLTFSNSYAQGELPDPELTAFTQGWATIYDQATADLQALKETWQLKYEEPADIFIG